MSRCTDQLWAIVWMLVAVYSRSAVIEALAAGKADALKGTAETSWLDFKTSPYPASDIGKFELCKDVASFANAQGGLLVLGVKARKQSDRAVEVAEELRPFPQSAADVDRYVDWLNEYLRPRVTVNHYWYPSHEIGERATFYLVVEVEPIAEADRYVLVKRMLSDRETLTEGLAIPIRHGDRTVFMTSGEAYRLINDGFRTRSIDRPANAISTVKPAPVPQAPDLEDAIEGMDIRQDWEEHPVLFWQTWPQPPIDLPAGLHSSDGIRGALRHQKVLRPNGFNFEDSLGKLDTFEGGLYLNKTRSALWIRPDGIVTGGGLATTALLCWAMEQRNMPERLNVVVLTEMTVEYFRIADETVMPHISGGWHHRVSAHGFQDPMPRLLGPGGTGFRDFLSDASPASTDRWDRSWPAVGEAERDAYEALLRIYTLFGVDVASNPFVEGNRIISSRLASY